ncbi:MAG: hypothetical protein ACI4IK_02905 [Eubacterium sp.]
MADGSIKIKTKLDNTEAQKDLNDLEKMCDRTAKNVEKTNAKVTVKTETDDGVSAKKKSKWISVINDSSLKKAQARLQSIRDEIKQIEADTDKDLRFAITDEQTENLLELEARVTKELSAEYDHLIQQVNQYKQAKQEALDEKLGEKQAKETFNNASAELSADANSTAFLSKIQTQEQYNAALATTKARMLEIETSAQRIASEKGVDYNALLMANNEYKKLNSRLQVLTAHQKEFKASTTNSFASASKMADKFGASIKRGIKKMSRYALAIFGARSAFFAVKQIMNSYISSNEDLSNSIAGIKGAFGEMLGPAIERFVNLIKIALSYVFAFVKALTGVDYVARYNAKALNKQASATKDLAKAQRQSAGFDEQNKLSETSSGSGASAGSSGGLELPTISDEALGKIQEFADKLKEAWDWVKANKEELLAVAAAVAIAFAVIQIVGWISSFETLAGALGKFGGIVAKFTGFILLATGIFLVVDAIKDIMENGLNWKNILELLGGAILVVIGVILIFNASLLASPITWIIIGIMALIAAIALCVTYWDEIKEAISKFVQKSVEKINEFGNKFKDTIKGAIDKVVGWFDGLKEKIGKLIEKIKDKLTEKFGDVGTRIGNAIEGAVKSIVNGVFSKIEERINKFINMINGAIGIINKIPGVSIKTIQEVSLPRLARGGIVSNVGKGVPLIAGEAGKEAILPLENNTEWMDVLADRIGGGNTTIPIYLDGKLIAKYIVDLQKRKAFATNGGF